MTAWSGGDGVPSRVTSTTDRSAAAQGASSGPRSLEQIFPQRTDATRARQMQDTWVAFFSEMTGAVKGILENGRSPPEIAYAIGETLHNYFRTRGVTLTSYELRRLVIELLDLQGRVRRAKPESPAGPELAQPELFDNGGTATLVSFADERAEAEMPWVGDEPVKQGPAVPDAVFEPPPSNLVSLPVRDGGGQPAAQPPQGSVAPISAPLKVWPTVAPRPDTAPPVAEAPPAPPRIFKPASVPTSPPSAPIQAPPALPPQNRPSRNPVPPAPVAQRPAENPAAATGTTADLLPIVVAALRARPPLISGQATNRDAVLRAIDAGIDDILQRRGEQLRADARQRLGHLAFSELYGLGLIDRLWADRTVSALLINGPGSVYVERNGVLEAAPETFRDAAHLGEVASRLARRSVAGRSAIGLADFQLRDGTGTVVFPPAAPSGPVIVVRRTEAGAATFEGLLTAGTLSQPMADLLRLANRARLNVLVSGAPGVGKTGLLAAMARDLGKPARIASVAREREFRSNAASMVEFVAQATPEASYPALVGVAGRLRPDLLLLDSVRAEDTPAILERLAMGDRGIVANAGHAATARTLEPSVDMILRLERGGDGVNRVVAVQDPAGFTLFAYENGNFARLNGEPAFAAALRAAGFAEALQKILK